MVEEGFQMRNLSLKEVLVQGIDHKVEKIGSVFAAVIMDY
jgi:arginine decarboxylase